MKEQELSDSKLEKVTGGRDINVKEILIRVRGDVTRIKAEDFYFGLYDVEGSKS